MECVKVLMGEAPAQIPSMTASAVGTETIDECLRTQSKYWKTLPQYVDRAGGWTRTCQSIEHER